MLAITLALGGEAGTDHSEMPGPGAQINKLRRPASLRPHWWMSQPACSARASAGRPFCLETDTFTRTATKGITKTTNPHPLANCISGYLCPSPTQQTLHLHPQHNESVSVCFLALGHHQYIKYQGRRQQGTPLTNNRTHHHCYITDNHLSWTRCSTLNPLHQQNSK